MRCVAVETSTLVKGFVHQADVTLLQVSEATVDQLRALRRRSAGEVVSLDEGDPKTPSCRVDGHTESGDTTPDHQDVELLVGESTTHRRTVERTRGGHVTRVVGDT
jgi:hypothetical protein